MRKISTMIWVSLLLYAGIFLLQLGFYVFSPSFYVTSPNQLHLPTFIFWSFVKYFGLIFILYALWGLFLGVWNGFLLGINQPLWKYKKVTLPFLSLCAAQFLGSLLYLGYLYPSIFNQYPGLRHLPLFISYQMIGVAIIVCAYYFLRSRTQGLWRGIPQVTLSLLLPIGLITLFYQESELKLPPAQVQQQTEAQDILLLGIDALDGDTGNKVLQKRLLDNRGVLFTNAFTPLPLTHPAWNSILTGLYPKNHGVRYFFDSPLQSKRPELFLPKILKKKKNYRSLYASDQPETSYFSREKGFTDLVLDRFGWEAHMVSTIFNHFVFPGLWLNNSLVEQWTGISLNYASHFNFDFHRFINQTFEKFSGFGHGPKLLALHTCYLHTPISLTRKELKTIPRYWAFAPKDFSFARWPKPGRPQQSTGKNWVNPYFIRRQTVVRFMEELLKNLEDQGYLNSSTIVVLSDHGERFFKDREIYGGVHGVDLETREQNNVVFTILNPKMPKLSIRQDLVSLIDLTPTLLTLLDIPIHQLEFDGVPLLNSRGKPRALPNRPLWVESMGFIDDHAEKDKFPQFAIETLEESLQYGENGSVTVGSDYYARILEKKEITDLSKKPQLWEKGGGS